ncbi:MAG: hypothetical protein KGL39_39290 [Patescibacteria group bacterium]|nr:hypothetical protein [Patescibacteria group bacterium]
MSDPNALGSLCERFPGWVLTGLIGTWLIGCLAFRGLVWLAVAWMNPPDPRRFSRPRALRLRISVRRPKDDD